MEFKCTLCENVFDLPMIAFGNVGMALGADCPVCGGPAQAIEDGYNLFLDIERRLHKDQITRKDARRIQKAILSANDLNSLPQTIAAINKDVGEAVSIIVQMNEAEPAIWKWLHRLAVSVGILVGVSVLSQDPRMADAIEWLKREKPGLISDGKNDVEQHEDSRPGTESAPDGESGPR